MGLFGKSFEEQVKEAIATVATKVPGARNLRADIDGKVVTLHGNAVTHEAKVQVMREFQALVQADNAVNSIALDTPAPPVSVQSAAALAPAPAVVAAPAGRIHDVVSGDTLSGIAKKYYGHANLYMKIFEANKDQLKDPNVIKVGQKLRIPE